MDSILSQKMMPMETLINSKINNFYKKKQAK